MIQNKEDILKEMRKACMKKNTCKVFNVATGKLIARNCSLDFAEKLAEQQGLEGGLVTRQNGSFIMMTCPAETIMSDEEVDTLITSLPKRDKRNYERYLRNKTVRNSYNYLITLN